MEGRLWWEEESQIAKLKYPFPLLRRMTASYELARDRKLVKSGGQRVSVVVSVPGFIRSEGGIYVGPWVIYRFRWHTRYRYTDIDTFLVRASRGVRFPFSPFSPPLISFLSFQIYPALLFGCFSPSFLSFR